MSFLSVEFAYIFLSTREVDKFFLVDCFVGFARTKLEPQAKTKLAGNLEILPQDVKGLIAQFLAYLEKEGYSKESHYPNNLKTLIKLGADLLNPESVKKVLGRHSIKNGAKL